MSYETSTRHDGHRGLKTEQAQRGEGTHCRCLFHLRAIFRSNQTSVSNGATEQLTVTLKDVADTDLFQIKLAPERG